MVCGIHVEMRKLNWDYIYYAIRNKSGYSVIGYCKHKLNKNESYLSQCKRGTMRLSGNVLTYMIKDLDLDQNALWQISELDQPEEPEENEMTAEEFNDKFTVKEESNDNKENGWPEIKHIPLKHIPTEDVPDEATNLLEEINTKLDMVLELESKINRLEEAVNEISNTPKESVLDLVIRAATLLKGA